MRRNFFLTIFLLLLSSCISRVEKHGYMFDISDSDMLQEGVTSKERVLKIMGSPTLVSDLGQGETWIYYSEEVKHLLFFTPSTKDREVLVLCFGSNDVINNLKKVSLNDENTKLVFAENFTEISDHESNFIKSFINNVGSVKAAQ